MSDSELIWKLLSREYPDNHQAIYVFVTGSLRSQKSVIDSMSDFTLKIFSPSITRDYIKTIVTAYLERKKKLYWEAKISIKPIY